MSTASLSTGAPHPSALTRAVRRVWNDPAYQAFLLLRIGFTALPIAMGADKFFNAFVNWERYLAGWMQDLSPWTATGTMHVVGIVEITAGVLVALKPRYAAYVVAAWLAGIIVDLLTLGGYYDIALRDGALMFTAITLGRLASRYDAPGLGLRRHGA